jgi:hypothetical protein
MKSLPKSYTKGAKKAFVEFQKFYGQAEGERIFFQRAEEQGTGQTKRQRVNSVYKTGAKLKGRKNGS